MAQARSINEVELSLDTHPHSCALSRLVVLSAVVWDKVLGKEVEGPDVVPCRRCAEARADGRTKAEESEGASW
jgi:hypothetical protein